MSRSALTTRVMAVTVLGVMMFAGGAALAQPEGTPAAKQPSGEQPRRPRGPVGEGREGRGPSVEGAMKGMSRALKSLKAQVGEPGKQEVNLLLVVDLERACLAAKSGIPGGPKMKAAKTEAEKAEIIKTFRSHLILVAHAALELESQLIEGKTAEAKETLVKIQKLQGEGHHALGLDQDDKADKAEKGEKGEKPGAK